MQRHHVKTWLKGQARSASKKEQIKSKYHMTKAEHISNAHIHSMFAKLDTDQSKTLDMDEMTELFFENGIDMTKE